MKAYELPLRYWVKTKTAQKTRLFKAILFGEIIPTWRVFDVV